MNIKLVQKGSGSLRVVSHERISFARFLKSVGDVGIADANFFDSMLRGMAFALYNRHYFRIGPPVGFRRSPAMRYDPSDIGDFSTVVGRAVADYFARKISRARLTHAYEAAMLVRGMVVRGSRPDLYCDTGEQQFALEAKGFSIPSVSENAMERHKNQASSGPIPVHFSVAAVTFNIFSHPTCKYYDPDSDYSRYDEKPNRILAQLYYSRVLDMADSLREHKLITLRNLKVEVHRLPSYASDVPVSLLLDPRVRDSPWKMRPIEWPEAVEEDGLFLDCDGVGILVG